MKILILKPSSLGDIVHALPVLRLLKKGVPGSEIYWWVESSFVPLLQDDPDLSGIFVFRRDRWAAPKHWGEITTTIRAMRRQRFDWAIDLQGLARSGVFTWFANAGLSIGLDNESEGAREGAQIYYDVLVPPAEPHTHAVDRYLDTLRFLGVPVHNEFEWLPENPRVAAQLREKWPVSSARWIALLPGARWNNKRWPVMNFRELAGRLLAESPDLRIVILGGGGDAELGREIAAVNPQRCLDLTGKTSLTEMVEWTRLSALMITNDTGPMHIAAALRKPVVAIFGPTDPRHTGPYGQLGNVLRAPEIACVPCMTSRCQNLQPLACLYAITPEIVCRRAVESLR